MSIALRTKGQLKELLLLIAVHNKKKCQ